MRVPKPLTGPYPASAGLEDIISAHKSTLAIASQTGQPLRGTVRMPRSSLAGVLPGEKLSRGELGGLPALHPSWPPALLEGQSRNQDLARLPGKRKGTPGLLGAWNGGHPVLGGTCGTSGTFRDSKGAA